LKYVNSWLVRAPLPERCSPGDSRTAAQGLFFEGGLLLRSAIGVQLKPPLCREVNLADGLCLSDIGQEFLLECVSHNAELKPVLELGAPARSPLSTDRCNDQNSQSIKEPELFHSSPASCVSRAIYVRLSKPHIHDFTQRPVLGRDAPRVVEIAVDRMLRALCVRSDTDLGDKVAMPYRGHRPVRAEQRIAHRRLCCLHEREHLLPCPVLLRERPLTGEKVSQELAEPFVAARKVLGRVVANLLDEQIVLRRAGDEVGLFFSTRSNVFESGSSSTSFVPLMPKILIAKLRTGPRCASGPKWFEAIEKRISAPRRPGFAYMPWDRAQAHHPASRLLS
jgi:hypothetical protein